MCGMPLNLYRLHLCCCRSPGMGVWAQKPQFTNQIQWIFSIYIIFGHRQSFLKNCSPSPIPFWAQQRFLQEKFQLSLESKENISSKHVACAQSRFIAIEIIVSVFYISSPVPKRRESMGNISVKSAPVPKPSCRATGTTRNETVHPWFHSNHRHLQKHAPGCHNDISQLTPTPKRAPKRTPKRTLKGL